MPYLIHLPHCGLKIPNQFLDDYYLSAKELQNNIYEYCDIYTDELFDSMFEKFGGVKNQYSRLFFDPERFSDDNQEEMYKKYRLGWFYENAIIDKKSLRKLDNKDKVKKYYDEHHKQLDNLTQQKLDMFNQCTIIDCHSFSDKEYWFLKKTSDFPDICIGYEEYHLDENLIEIIKDEFSEYKIGLNTPYSGSLVPMRYWHKDNRVKSVMIEINKRIYTEQDNKTKNKNFVTVKNKIDNILNKITNQRS